jgi:hypothetical protein
MKRPLGFLLSSLLLATVVGCQKGEGQTYANVKGTVTFNGKPIEKGQISFALEGRPPSTVDIVDGKFAGQAMVGSNKVSVSAKRKSAAAAALPKSADTQVKGYQAKFKTNPGEFGGSPVAYDPSMVDYIPPEWGLQSKQMRVVESGGANDFEINIKGN